MSWQRVEQHVRVAADLDLDGAESALRHSRRPPRPAAPRPCPRVEPGRGIGVERVPVAAEQAVERRLGRLADDIPEGDIDPLMAIISIPRAPR